MPRRQSDIAVVRQEADRIARKHAAKSASPGALSYATGSGAQGVQAYQSQAVETGTVANLGNAPSIETGNYADLPAAGSVGAIYITADTPRRIYRDNGSSWDLQATIDHGLQVGLADDDHTVYALLAGRSGGQTLIGSTASGGNLELESTSDATKGALIVKVGTKVGVGTASPTALLTVGDGYIFALDGTNNTPTGGRGVGLVCTGDVGYLVSYDYDTTTSKRLNILASDVRLEGGTLYVGANSAPDANYYLQLPNDAAKKAKAYAWDTYASSLEWKEEANEIPGACSLLRGVKGIRFRHRYPDIKRKIDGEEITEPHPANGQEAIGVSAEDLDSLGLPGLVSKRPDGTYESINLTGLIPVLVQAVRELDARVRELEKTR